MRSESMTVEEFSKQLKDNLQGRLAEQYPGIELESKHVTGVGFPGYEGIVIKPADVNVGTVINVEPFFEEMSEGMTFDEILYRAREAVISKLSDIPLISTERMTDYGQMQNKVILQVVSKEGNAERLSELPHREMEDMAVIFRVMLEEDGRGRQSSYLVNHQILEGFGVSQDQLYSDAVSNMQKQYSIRPLFNVLADMNPVFADDPMPEPDNTLYVATNEKGMYGAGVIALPDFMKEAGETVRGSFFVLPSSIHEVLLLKDDGHTDYRALQEMVTAINATEVQPRDRLTDNVYHYDAAERVFETAKHFSERQMEKDMSRGSVLKNLADSRQKAQEQPLRPRVVPERGGAVL